MLENWREAIRWFFRTAKAQASGTVEVHKEDDAVAETAAGRPAPETEMTPASPATEKELGVPEDDEQPLTILSKDERQISSVMKRTGKSLNTERAYMRHYRNLLKQRKLSCAAEINGSEVKAYLEYLAMERGLASETQKQALNALVFIAQTVFQIDLGDIGDFVRAKKSNYIPVVLSKQELRRLFARLNGKKLLMAKLQYATGIRISELLRLRVKDLDLERSQLIL